MKGTLYLIPAPLSGEAHHGNYDDIVAGSWLFKQLKHFIVEDIRSARRYMRKTGYAGDFNDIQFFDIGKHSDAGQFPSYLDPCLGGEDIGLLSEAGMPCVADPGTEIVADAHSRGIRVMPIAGPSSIILALAASGLNGQAFVFHGYLPIDDKSRKQKLKDISRDISSSGRTHIFIEAPFRNDKLIKVILQNCPPELMLCIAASLQTEKEKIRTSTIAQWQKSAYVAGKQAIVYLLGSG